MDVWSQYSPHLDRAILVHAGTESDGSAIYVGRARHCGDLLPGKLLTGQGLAHRCHVSYNGEEHSKEAAEVLINNGYSWVCASDGHVPPHAVVGGSTSSGETLYVGRASHCGILTPGKVHPSHRCLYLPFGWKEHRYTQYEVLVRNQPTCPPVHPPCVCPPVCPPVQPPVCPPVCPPVQPPVCPPVQPPVCPPVQPPVCPPVKPPVCPPVQPPVCPPSRPNKGHRRGHHHGHGLCKSFFRK